MPPEIIIVGEKRILQGVEIAKYQIGQQLAQASHLQAAKELIYRAMQRPW